MPIKSTLLTIIFVFTISLSSKANMDCIWTSSKQGVKITLVAPCMQKYRLFIDSVLSQILHRLNRKDTSIKILVLVNSELLSFPNSNSSIFVSIAFDTLRKMDDEYISDYYFSKEGQINKRFSKRFEPLDINATNSDTLKEVGLKIIYRLDYRQGEPDWDQIENLIRYSEENIELIKKNQKRNNVRYDFNGWYVSLLTIDTLTLKGILSKPGISSKVSEKSKNSSSYLIFSLVGISLIGVLIIVKGNRSH